MFEELASVKDSWLENNPVLIHDHYEDSYAIVIPLQIISMIHLDLFRRYTANELKLTLPYSHFRDLELPTMEVLIRGMSSRYPLLALMAENDQSRRNESLTIGPIPLVGDIPDYSEISATLRKLGDQIEEYNSGNISKEEYRGYWKRNFKCPGSIHVIKLSYYELRKNHLMADVASTLAEISGYPNSVLFDFVQDEGGRANELSSSLTSMDLVTIDAKTVINLWRSIKKISKTEIEYI